MLREIHCCSPRAGLVTMLLDLALLAPTSDGSLRSRLELYYRDDRSSSVGPCLWSRKAGELSCLFVRGSPFCMLGWQTFPVKRHV